MASTTGWDEFGEDLGLTLPLLQDRVRLTISWLAVPTVYVQVLCAADRLWLRAGADDIVGPALAAASSDAAAFEVRGWSPPSTDPSGLRTWWTTLQLPAWSGDHARLAAMVVGLLRDVRGVPGPSELEYRAERDAEEPPRDALFYEEDLEPGVAHVVLNQLGIRDANPGPVDA